MTTEQALERARALAEDAHCRYCDVGTQDKRLKCRTDLETSTAQIASALMRTWADAMQSVTNHMTDYHCKLVDEKAVRIRAEAYKLEKGE